MIGDAEMRPPDGRGDGGGDGGQDGGADVAWLRNPAIAATEIDAETFLVEPDGGEVFYLDAVSSALWRVLAEPHTRAEIAEIFAAAFPDVAPAKIAADIAAAIGDLSDRGLVVKRP